jgi:hypothetical protein
VPEKIDIQYEGSSRKRRDEENLRENRKKRCVMRER